MWLHKMMLEEKLDKHVFRKSRKYHSLCSVALGAVVATIVGFQAQVAQADEVGPNANPATNLTELKPQEHPEYDKQAAQAGQASGDIPIEISHEGLDKAVENAKAEGVQVVTDEPKNLGQTHTAAETKNMLSKAQSDIEKQTAEVNTVTKDYVNAKKVRAEETKQVQEHNQALESAYGQASSHAHQANQKVQADKESVLKEYPDAKIQVTQKEVKSGDGTSKSNFDNYTKAIQAVVESNQESLETYRTLKSQAEATKAKNQTIQAKNQAGLARMREENEAIAKRNQAGQAAVDLANKTEKEAVDRRNAEKQKQASNRDAEIAAIRERNRQKTEAVHRQNQVIDQANQADLARYNREKEAITRGEEGYISEALVQALNLNDGEPQARHGAATRNPDTIMSRGDSFLGGYNNILDSTGFFVYNSFRTGETLEFDYSNLTHASFAGKKISRIHYAITNTHSPLGTNAVKLLVPNDPTEGFIAFRGDGNGNWREDKMEFRLVAKYYLTDGSQVTFTPDKPGVFTHSSLNHNDIGLEYVKNPSGRFVPIHGSTIQVTNEGIARSLGSNRAGDLHLPEEWDTTSSRLAYKGAIVSTVTSGNSYSVTFGQGDMPANAGGISYWFALNTLPVAKTVRPYQPRPHVTAELEPLPDPIHATPEVYHPRTFTPEKPVHFQPKDLEKVTEPSLNLVSVPLPHQPVLRPLPKPVAPPRVHISFPTLTTQVGIQKEVENKEQASLNHQQVAKNSLVIFPLKVASLSPNRGRTNDITFDDFLPQGYQIELELIKSSNPDYQLSFDAKRNFLQFIATDKLLESVNREQRKSFDLPIPRIYGRVQNDGASYTNTYTLTINKNSAHVYRVTSNQVEVHTPGDGEKTSRIQPQKVNRNKDGVVIDGKIVPFGTRNFYTLKWDLDQYRNDRSSKEAIDKGFFFVEDYPEEALEVDRQSWMVQTETGQKVEGIELVQFEKLTQAPQKLQDQLKAAGIVPKGAFLLYIPKDNTAFYQNYVQKGLSLIIRQEMTLKDSLVNKDVTYTNKGYQLDFGNGYVTKEVTNRVRFPKPEKKNLDRQGKDIDRLARLVGSENVYTLTWDLDQYAGIEASKDQVAAGFYFVEDYPEKAVELEPNQISLVTKSGERVKGIKIHRYDSLDQAPKQLQEALKRKKITPHGAFQLFEPENMEDFYKSYVQTGQSLRIIDPMRVKTSLYNSGKSYQNQAYQVDFGLAYATEIVKNHVPKVQPHKENRNAKGILINGKMVLPDTLHDYHIQLDYRPYKGITVDPADIAKGFYMIDDYPEEALDVDTNKVQVTDSKGKRVEGLSVRAYQKVENLPEFLKVALDKQTFKVKGAILVVSADKLQDFFNHYVHTGEQLTVRLPMMLKKDFIQRSGEYENTAYQVDFGIAYITETIVNRIPKLDSHKDVVIDVHDTKRLDGQEIHLHQNFTYRLIGSLIPKNRAAALTDYSFLDDYDETHDSYAGHYQVFAEKDIHLLNKRILKAGTELTKYTLQTLDTKAGKVAIQFDSDFLKEISDDSEFQASISLHMTRIAPGQVQNTAIHRVNGYDIKTNTVVTKTPEPPVPVTPKENQPKEERKELPHTGETSNGVVAMAGFGLLGLATSLKGKKGKDEDNL